MAVATVELAVCLPTLVLIFCAAVQAADTIFLKQSLHVASYETVRVAIKRKASNTVALTSGETILNARNVAGYAITFDPADVEAVDRGDVIAVTVAAPIQTNTVLPVWFLGDQNLTVTTKMVKE